MRKSLAIGLTFMMLLGIGLVQAESNDVPYILTTDGSSIGGEVIEISLTNESDAAITVSDVELAMVVQPEDTEPLTWARNILDPSKGDILLGGQSEVVIGPGETETIAVLAPGLPDTWRSFANAQHSLVISAWVKIDGVFWRLEDIEHDILPAAVLPYDLELSTAPTGFEPPESIILELTNNGNSAVTISGEVVVQGTEHWSNRPGQQRIRLPLVGGDSMTIAPGETVPIAEIEPGAPMSWQNFYSPKIIPLQAWLQVDGAEGAGLWQSEKICHPIVGEVVSEAFAGWARFTSDNEDGTATITVRVDHLSSVWGTKIENGSCTNYGENIIGEPVIDLKKEHFQVLRQLPSGGEEVYGQILSVQQTDTPGIYTLIWSHTEGSHSIFVQVLDPADLEFANYMISDHEAYPEIIWADPLFDVEVSNPSRPLNPVHNPETGNYAATLEYPSATLTFFSETEIDAEISLRRKGTSTHPVPEGAAATGIYLDINVVSGDLGDCLITLEVSYSLDDIPSGMNETDFKLFRFNEDLGQWELLPNQELDTNAKVIRVQLEGFSEFAIFEYQPDTDAPGTELPATGSNIQLLAFLGLLLVVGGIILFRRSKTA